MNYEGLKPLETPPGRQILEFGLEGEMQWGKDSSSEPTTGGIFWFSKKNAQGQWEIQFVSQKPAEDFFPLLKWFADKKGSMVTNGEYISNRVKELLDIHPFTRERDSHSLDFMGRRNMLSDDIIKKDKELQSLPEFTTKEKRSAFTRSLYRFIVTRNAVTHGTPYVLLPQRLLVLRYLDKATNAVVRSSCGPREITDFNDCFRYLKASLDLLVDKLLGKNKS